MTAPLDPAFVEAEPTLFPVAILVGSGTRWHALRNSSWTACGIFLPGRSTTSLFDPPTARHRCTRRACLIAFGEPACTAWEAQ